MSQFELVAAIVAGNVVSFIAIILIIRFYRWYDSLKDKYLPTVIIFFAVVLSIFGFLVWLNMQ